MIDSPTATWQRLSPPVDEHVTNVVTSCFQFAFNLGQVAALVERRGEPLRGDA